MIGLDAVLRNLDRHVGSLHQRGEAALSVVARHLVDWAKSEHGYHDQTGELTASITAFVQNAMGSTSARLTATSDHAKWVELAANGQWAFLLPVIERHKEDIKRLLAQEMML